MTTPSDQAAIARLHETLDLQRRAYLKEPDPSLATRLELLGRIPGMMMGNARRIAAALNDDYGYHNELTAYLFDVLNVAERGRMTSKFGDGDPVPGFVVSRDVP